MTIEKSTDELLQSIKNNKQYSDFLKENQSQLQNADLSELLNFALKEKGVKISDVMLKSNITRAYIYQLFDGTKKNPTRDKLIQLCFGFCFSFDEAQNFLKHTGMAPLYSKFKRDSIIIYCLSNKKDIIECRQMLLENDEKDFE